MNVRSYKAHKQRFALLEECYDLGVWTDEDDFRRWLYAQFGTTSRKKLSDKQLKVWWAYMMHFTGRITRLTFDASLPWRIQPQQKWRIEQFQELLGWSDDQLNQFITRQLGVKTFVGALSKEAATTLITGLEETYGWTRRKAQ